MRDLVLLIACLVMLPAALFRPHVGALLWVWTSFLAPGDYVYGFMASAPINRGFALLTMASMVVSRERKRLRIDANLVLMGIFLLIGFGAAQTALFPSADVDELFEKVAKILVLSVVVCMVMTTRFRLHALLIALSAGLSFHGIEEGLKFMASAGNHKVTGVRILGDNNSFALAEAMLLPLLTYLARYFEDRRLQVLTVMAIVICAVSVIGSFSRGGFIALLIYAIGMILTTRRKLLLSSLLVIAAGAMVMAVPDDYINRVNSIGKAGEDASFMGRVVAWKISTLIALDHPFLGGGFHAVQTPVIWTSYAPYIYKLDFIPTPPPDVVRAAHSIYFEVLGDLGFTGLAVFVCLLLVGIRNAGQVRRLTRGRPDQQWMFDLAGALRLSLVIYAISGAALSVAYFEVLYLVLAVLSVLRWKALDAKRAARIAPVPVASV